MLLEINEQPQGFLINIIQGATFQMQWIIANDDGSFIDLTGYSAKMELRKRYSDADPTATWGTAEGGITLDASKAAINFFVTSTATGSLISENGVIDYIFDCFIFNDADPPFREPVAKGLVRVWRASTRWA